MYRALSAQSNLPSYRLVSPAGGQGATGFSHKERQVSGGKQNSILAGTGAGWRSWKVSLHKTKRAGAGCSGFPHLAVQGKGVRRKLAQHQSATFFVKYVYSGFFFSAIKLQMPKVPTVLIFSSGQIRYNLF